VRANQIGHPQISGGEPDAMSFFLLLEDREQHAQNGGQILLD